MPKIPQLKAKELIRIFEEVGFIHQRTKGSHFVMHRELDGRILVVPLHGSKPLGTGLLNALIKDANLSKEEFINLI